MPRYPYNSEDSSFSSKLLTSSSSARIKLNTLRKILKLYDFCYINKEETIIFLIPIRFWSWPNKYEPGQTVSICQQTCHLGGLRLHHISHTYTVKVIWWLFSIFSLVKEDLRCPSVHYFKHRRARELRMFCKLHVAG